MSEVKEVYEDIRICEVMRDWVEVTWSRIEVGDVFCDLNDNEMTSPRNKTYASLSDKVDEYNFALHPKRGTSIIPASVLDSRLFVPATKREHLTVNFDE